ncbi:MAG: hypothetical protein ACRD2N_14640 [Vicinamibacterales bacterium]
MTVFTIAARTWGAADVNTLTFPTRDTASEANESKNASRARPSEIPRSVRTSAAETHAIATPTATAIPTAMDQGPWTMDSGLGTVHCGPFISRLEYSTFDGTLWLKLVITPVLMTGTTLAIRFLGPAGSSSE